MKWSDAWQSSAAAAELFSTLQGPDCCSVCACRAIMGFVMLLLMAVVVIIVLKIAHIPKSSTVSQKQCCECLHAVICYCVLMRPMYIVPVRFGCCRIRFVKSDLDVIKSADGAEAACAARLHAAVPHVMYIAFDRMCFVIADIISSTTAATAPKRAKDAWLQRAHTSPTSLYYYVVVSM